MDCGDNPVLYPSAALFLREPELCLLRQRRHLSSHRAGVGCITRQGQHVLDQQIRRAARASLAGASLSLSTLPQAGRDRRSRRGLAGRRDVNDRLVPAAAWQSYPNGT